MIKIKRKGGIESRQRGPKGLFVRLYTSRRHYQGQYVLETKKGHNCDLFSGGVGIEAKSSVMTDIWTTCLFD